MRKLGLQERYNTFKRAGLALDMTRGKPCKDQLNLSTPLLREAMDGAVTPSSDLRNYGQPEGIPEARDLFSHYFGVSSLQVLVQGNSSLALMHDTIVQALLLGVHESNLPWGKLPKAPTFICPVPGYDRHFVICERYGIEMIPVHIKKDGPDMDEVERLVKKDPSIKGIWCVPKYSNPTGATYSDEVVDRLARMETAAQDFRIFWDNAYAVHHLNGHPALLKNILQVCEEAGTPNRPILFGSTSKITFAGSGIAMVAGSEANIAWLKSNLGIQTIGPDKLNQLRHVKFLKDMPTILNLMRLHAEILKPKFDAVLSILQDELGEKELATWTNPTGGYFISVDVPHGCAETTVKLAREAGLHLTNAGATFPYRNDPMDSNIRIAPTFPSLDELYQAAELFCLCVELAAQKIKA